MKLRVENDMQTIDKLTGRLKGIQTRVDSATPGQWDAHDVGPTRIGIPGKKDILVQGWDNARFIASARSDVPFLLAVIEEMKTALETISEYTGSDWRRMAMSATAEGALVRCRRLAADT